MKINAINNDYFHRKAAIFIKNSPKIQKILRFVDKNPSLAGSAFMFATSTTIRPISILLTSSDSKDKDKKKDALYSASRSISSGIVDLLFTSLFFIPFGRVLDKSTRVLYNSKNTIYFQNKEACSMWKSMANRGIDILLLPIMAYLSFKYLKKIAEKMSGNGDNTKNSD